MEDPIILKPITPTCRLLGHRPRLSDVDGLAVAQLLEDTDETEVAIFGDVVVDYDDDDDDDD